MMTVPDEIFPHKAYVARRLGTTSEGEQFGAPREVNCLIEDIEREVTVKGDKTKRTSTTLYVRGEPGLAITAGDRATVPGAPGLPDSERPIASVEYWRGGPYVDIDIWVVHLE